MELAKRDDLSLLEYLKHARELELQAMELDMVAQSLRERARRMLSCKDIPLPSDSYPTTHQHELASHSVQKVILGAVAYTFLWAWGASILQIIWNGVTSIFGIKPTNLIVIVVIVISLAYFLFTRLSDWSSARDSVYRHEKVRSEFEEGVWSESRRIGQDLQAEATIIDEKLITINLAKDSIYSLNLVFPKYHQLIAISSFIEYFESGRCEHLEGPYGAYNLFENEVRFGIIIGKLDDILKRLDTIIDNQFSLYSAIQQANQRLESLNRSLNDGFARQAQLTEYHGRAIAAEQRALAFYTISRDVGSK